MTKLLLLTDFSDNATNAIKYALDLFKDQACECTILNIQKAGDFTTDDLIVAKPGSSVFESIIADNRQTLDNYLEQLRTAYPGNNLNFKAQVDYDVFTDSVNQVVAQQDIDYVVMGTNGATGAKEVLFGSNTLQVIRQVSSPLIVVPEGYTFKAVNNILFTQSQPRDLDRINFDPLFGLMPKGATIHLLGIHPKAHSVAVDTQLEGLKSGVFGSLTAHVATLDGLETPAAINAYEQLHPVNLHVFFAQHESLLHRLLFGSKTGQISHKTRVPLLILEA